jgi:hypothetical protein
VRAPAKRGSKRPAKGRAAPKRDASRQDAARKVRKPALLLANAYKNHDPSGWWMSEKLDGVRAFWDGKRFISRLGNVFPAPDFYKRGMPKTPLDGELIRHWGVEKDDVPRLLRLNGSWIEQRYGDMKDTTVRPNAGLYQMADILMEKVVLMAGIFLRSAEGKRYRKI